MVTNRTGQLKQLQRLFEGDGLNALVLRHLGEGRLLIIIGRTNLYNRSETTNLHEDRLAAFGILTQHTLTGLMLLTAVDGTFYRRFKLLVERVHHVRPLLITLGYLIEILLHLGGKVVIHNLCEVFHQEVVDHNTDIGRYQLTLLRTHNLLTGLLVDLLALQLINGIWTVLTFLVTLLHILTLLDGADGGRIG